MEYQQGNVLPLKIKLKSNRASVSDNQFTGSAGANLQEVACLTIKKGCNWQNTECKQIYRIANLLSST